MTDICEFYGEAFIKARYAFLIGVHKLLETF